MDCFVLFQEQISTKPRQALTEKAREESLALFNLSAITGLHVYWNSDFLILFVIL